MDKKLFALASDSRLTIVKSVEPYEKVYNTVYKDDGDLRCIDFSSDGIHVSGIVFLTAYIWNLSTAVKEHTLDLEVYTHDRYVETNEIQPSVAYSNSGKWLATLVDSVVIWDTTTWNTHYILYNCVTYFKSIAWSPDDKLFAVTQADVGTRIFKTIDWTNMDYIYENTFKPSFSPNGNTIAIGNDGSIKTYTLCKWSEKTNAFFGDVFKSIMFYMCCIFYMGDLNDMPFEMFLEVLEATSLVIINCK